MDCLIIEKLSVNVLCSLHAYNQNIKKLCILFMPLRPNTLCVTICQMEYMFGHLPVRIQHHHLWIGAVLFGVFPLQLIPIKFNIIIFIR